MLLCYLLWKVTSYITFTLPKTEATLFALLPDNKWVNRLNPMILCLRVNPASSISQDLRGNICPFLLPI
jgi:hypothetical protein